MKEVALPFTHFIIYSSTHSILSFTHSIIINDYVISQ